MDQIIALGQHIIAWFGHQNWFVLSFAIVGWLNVIVAGARVMGWNQLAVFCGKLEDAIQAMVTAALNRKNGAVQPTTPTTTEGPKS